MSADKTGSDPTAAVSKRVLASMHHPLAEAFVAQPGHIYLHPLAPLNTDRWGAECEEFVNDQERELGIEAHAVVDGLVGQRGGEIFE
jgi:hypothetical protein